jgi:hypothetical protein
MRFATLIANNVGASPIRRDDTLTDEAVERRVRPI